MRFLISCLALAAWHGTASAADVDVIGQRLAASCASCHAPSAMRRMAPAGLIPGLAGQARDQIVASMAAFKAGTRPSSVMQQLAKGYSDEQIERIAAVFAAMNGEEPR